MNKQRQRPPKELAVSEQATVPAKIGQWDGQTRVAHILSFMYAPISKGD